VKRLQTRLWNQLIQPINHNGDILIQVICDAKFYTYTLKTQDLPPIYEENSCLYIFTRNNLEMRHNRIGQRPIMFQVTEEESIDIDTKWDFKLANILMSAEKNSKKYS
jgi:CMP-N-acetylneuraminic acid synthetase